MCSVNQFLNIYIYIIKTFGKVKYTQYNINNLL